MLIYQDTTASQNEDDVVQIFPIENDFLLVRNDGTKVIEVSKLDKTKLSEPKGHFHYFDTGISYNLMPRLSEEMIDEKALVSFFNWNENSKVYRSFHPSTKIELQFQTEIAKVTPITQANASVNIHHILGLFLDSKLAEGVTVLTYAGKLIVGVLFENDVKLCNIFPCTTDEEILYYSLMVYQEIDLDQEVIPLHFYGSFIQNVNRTEELLSSYIRNVNIHQFNEVNEIHFSGLVEMIKSTL